MSGCNVTLVTVYFAPEVSPITHLYADLASDLVKYGANVTVVTGAASRGLTDAQREEYRARTDERTPAGYRILRTIGGGEGRNLIARGLYLLKSTVSLYRTAKRVPTDVYLLGSMPPFLGYVGAKLAKRARTVYIVQDIFPDTVILMGKLSRSGLLTRLCRAMERATYRGNTRFVTISPDMARTLYSRGVPESRVDVIGNWADTNAISPVERASNPLFDECSIPRNAFTVLYAGVLGILQNPMILLDAAKRLLPHADIRFVVFGEGALREPFKARIASEGLTNVQLLPLQPGSRISEVYSVGDIAVVPLKKGVTDVAMPSKTWSAMAAGRPVLVTADEGSAWAATVRDAGCGAVVPPEDAQALVNAILSLYEKREQLPQMGENARDYAIRALSREHATRAYYEVLCKE